MLRIDAMRDERHDNYAAHMIDPGTGTYGTQLPEMRADDPNAHSSARIDFIRISQLRCRMQSECSY